MPFYVFSTKPGEKKEFFLSIEEMESRRLKNGKFRLPDGSIGEKDFRETHRGTFHHAGNWPMKSDALGVAEDQIQEATEHARKNGVPVEFTADGRAILNSAGHRKAYARLCGFRDRNAGYSDP